MKIHIIWLLVLQVFVQVRLENQKYLNGNPDQNLLDKASAALLIEAELPDEEILLTVEECESGKLNEIETEATANEEKQSADDLNRIKTIKQMENDETRIPATNEMRFNASDCQAYLEVKRIIMTHMPHGKKLRKERHKKLKALLHQVMHGMLSNGAEKKEIKKFVRAKIREWRRVFDYMKYSAFEEIPDQFVEQIKEMTGKEMIFENLP